MLVLPMVVYGDLPFAADLLVPVCAAAAFGPPVAVRAVRHRRVRTG